jgi:hypothetical protein
MICIWADAWLKRWAVVGIGGYWRSSCLCRRRHSSVLSERVSKIRPRPGLAAKSCRYHKYNAGQEQTITSDRSRGK